MLMAWCRVRIRIIRILIEKNRTHSSLLLSNNALGIGLAQRSHNIMTIENTTIAMIASDCALIATTGNLATISSIALFLLIPKEKEYIKVDK